MKKIIFTLFLCMTSSFAFSNEAILGFDMSSEGLTFTVTSGGCTGKEDFKVEQLESHPLQLRLVRVNFDLCEAYMPYGEKIKFSYEELSLNPGTIFTIVNPLAVFRVN